MFGIKIIKEEEYNILINRCERLEKATEEMQNLYLKEKKDCKSLREQNSELRLEKTKHFNLITALQNEAKSLRNFRRDTLKALGEIDIAGFQLSYCTKRCEHCKRENKGCKKYKFGSHEYCVIKK